MRSRSSNLTRCPPRCGLIRCEGAVALSRRTANLWTMFLPWGTHAAEFAVSCGRVLFLHRSSSTVGYTIMSRKSSATSVAASRRNAANAPRKTAASPNQRVAALRIAESMGLLAVSRTSTATPRFRRACLKQPRSASAPRRRVRSSPPHSPRSQPRTNWVLGWPDTGASWPAWTPDCWIRSTSEPRHCRAVPAIRRR